MRRWALVLGLCVLASLAGCFLQPRRALLHPPARAAAAPALYQVTFTTTRGPIVIAVHRAWAPRGADRFYYLARHDFYNGAAFFRVVPRFVVQWGLGPDPQINMAWDQANIPDDPVIKSNTRGMVTYAMGGPNSRTTQVYINLGNNARLDKLGFAPFGQVTQGMDVVDQLYAGYGDGAPRGHGPSQRRLQHEGAAYLQKNFPKLDRILLTRVSHP
ncbi:MAG TPA: peptidylprolyl isomerase [Terriglobales bacterium]|nr:peptidylprolyl isomerase [Terriglobales bacterium]